MTDRQAQIDPWDEVSPIFADICVGTTERVYIADDVDAARAADAAQIASLTAKLDTFKECERMDREEIIALRAKRDALQADNQMLRDSNSEIRMRALFWSSAAVTAS